MEWLIKIIQKLFKKDKIKLIEEPKNIQKTKEQRNDFILDLVQNADSERDDKNGYKIIPNIQLKDML